MSLRTWSQLWYNDPERWISEIRDRPSRFDRQQASRAIRVWWNQAPPGSGSRELPLRGVPIVVKDLYDVTGEATGCSSRVLLEQQSPRIAVRNATILQRVLDAGANVAGRAHMNEFAYGLDGRNSYTGDCTHPLDSRRISGGSSSGSAWSVAAGIVPVAFGTDTGGSIRVPAALCGIWGYRSSWDPDLLSGVFPLAPSFDTVGWFTADPQDMMETLSILGPQGTAVVQPETSPEVPRDFRYCVPAGVTLDRELSHAISRWIADINGASEGALRITAVPDAWQQELDDLVERGSPAYNVIGSHEAWTVHADWLDRYRDAYDPVVWALIDRGRHWSSQRITDARAVMREVRERVRHLMTEVDGLVLPTVPRATPTFAEADGTNREVTLRLNVLGSLAGVPGLAIPIPLDEVRSGGVQVLVPPDGEHRWMSLIELCRQRQ